MYTTKAWLFCRYKSCQGPSTGIISYATLLPPTLKIGSHYAVLATPYHATTIKCVWSVTLQYGQKRL